MVIAKPSPTANTVDASPRIPSRCVIHTSSGVAKPSTAMPSALTSHSSEYSSDSRRRRTSSSTKIASATAARAAITWVRDRNIMARPPSHGTLDPRHQRGQQVLVRVVERLAQRIERLPRPALAHLDRHLLESKAAPHQGDEQRGVGKVLRELVLADLH